MVNVRFVGIRDALSDHFSLFFSTSFFSLLFVPFFCRFVFAMDEFVSLHCERLRSLLFRVTHIRCSRRVSVHRDRIWFDRCMDAPTSKRIDANFEWRNSSVCSEIHIMQLTVCSCACAGRARVCVNEEFGCSILFESNQTNRLCLINALRRTALRFHCIFCCCQNSYYYISATYLSNLLFRSARIFDRRFL